MKRLFLVCLLLISAQQFAKTDGKSNDQIPNVGDQVNPKWIVNGELCMTHSSQLDPCFKHDFGGIKFTVAFNNHTKKISYIATTDQSFRTSDGLRIGSEVDVTSETVKAFPGWIIFAGPTADGWWPMIGFADTVKLKDGAVLRLSNRQGSEKGAAIVQGFAKGQYLSR